MATCFNEADLPAAGSAYRAHNKGADRARFGAWSEMCGGRRFSSERALEDWASWHSRGRTVASCGIYLPVYHFVQTLPINERTFTTPETPRKHPGPIHNPSNRTLMVSVVTCRHHVGRWRRRMIFRDSTMGVCPVCHRATTIAVIEPHPTLTGLEIHMFNCDVCGPSKSKVVETPLGRESARPGGGFGQWVRSHGPCDPIGKPAGALGKLSDR
jgi:hypothetical protein